MFKRFGPKADKKSILRLVSAMVFSVLFITGMVLIAMAGGTPTSGAGMATPGELAGPVTRASFIPSARDTQADGGPVALPETTLHPSFVLLYENEDMAFYYRAERNVFAFRDKRIGYIWKSGLDVPLAADVDDFVRNLTPEQRLALDEEIFRVVRMSNTFINIANSVLTIEFFTAADTLSNTSSNTDGVTTTLAPTAAPNRFIMTSEFHAIDLTVRVHITFDGTRVIYDIPNDGITGEGRGVLSAIHLVPFKGATGGVIERLDRETGMFNREAVPMIPGYFFVPDGSGALIRFQYNYMNFTEYRGHVFGIDYGQSQIFRRESSSHIPLRNPTMPVFGVSHGNGKAGFIAYTLQGAEYKEIVVMPHQHTTYYNWIYPRFVYNRTHLHIYDRRGSGFLVRRPDISAFDVTIVYDFLAAVDGQTACYVGMARAYRAHLMETGQLAAFQAREPGVRIDFLMSDISPNIVSHSQVTLTDVHNVQDILTELTALGVNNITTNLLGWQRNGITGGHPGRVSFRNAVGSRGDFVALTDFARAHGIRLAFAREYFEINNVQMNNFGNAAVHLNGQFITTDISGIMPPGAAVTERFYARPTRGAEWLLSNLNRLDFMDYHAVFGITGRLISDHTGSGIADRFQVGQARTGMLVQDTRQLLEDTFAQAATSHGLFLHQANQYLFRFATAYLDIPVFNSQHLIQTDTVPFLQMVLHGTMDMFAPYSNFSFYTDRDVLRMIDYNVMPSFVVTQNPSHMLQHTNSAHFYTTEYGRYRDMILRISNTVQNTLRQVVGYQWVDRYVVEIGVVVNTYHGPGGSVRQIIINYTDFPVEIGGVVVPPVSAEVTGHVINPRGGIYG